jgi:hypothetical protein
MIRQDNHSVNHTPMTTPPTIPMNARKVDECNDIAAFDFPRLLLMLSLDEVEEGEAVLDTEVAILLGGTIVYVCPANEVVVPLGARVM